jgi:DNA (cytosine-5)-methyltransferase 1
MLKVRTLFSGIGAPEIALRNLKIPYELVDFCEVDKYAVKSYCAIHGVSEEKNLGDITKVWGRNLPYADLLAWGFPCTDISVAGKQKGIIEGETRSGLYYEGLRILKETKPKYSVIENVKNLTGKKFKSEFEQILKDLDEAGYNNYWKVLNAKDYGIPQNRERVFIVSIRKDVDEGNFLFPGKFDNGVRLKDLLEIEVDEKFYVSEEKTEKLINQLKDNPYLNKNKNYTPTEWQTAYPMNSQDFVRTGFQEISYTLSARDYKDPKIVCVGNIHPSQKRMNGNVFDTEGGLAPTITTNKGEGSKIIIPCITPDRVEKRQNGRRFKEDGDPSFTLTSQDRHGILQIGKLEDMNGHDICKRVYSPEGTSPTIPTGQSGNTMPKILQGLQINQAAVVNYRIRKLTPLECWRLMGFADEDFQKAVDAGVSNSQLYKQAGNSIVTDVLFYIFKNLLQAEIAAVYEEDKELS